MATKIVNNGKQAELLKFLLWPCHLSIDRRILLYLQIPTHFSSHLPLHFPPLLRAEEVNLQRRARKIEHGKELLLFRVVGRGMEKLGKSGRERGKTKTKTSTQNDIPRQSKGGLAGRKNRVGKAGERITNSITLSSEHDLIFMYMYACRCLPASAYICVRVYICECGWRCCGKKLGGPRKEEITKMATDCWSWPLKRKLCMKWMYKIQNHLKIHFNIKNLLTLKLFS